MIFESVAVDITTDTSGDAIVYLAPSINRAVNGFLVLLKYTPGTLLGTADLEITGESSGIPILTVTDVDNTSVSFYYPRALTNAVADGAAGSAPSELIPINNERIKVEVAQGGSEKAGSIEAIVVNQGPY